jgi:hypothetical protein
MYSGPTTYRKEDTMSVYSVTRKVDTVIVEMDIDVAEKLLEVLMQVDDTTNRYTNDLADLGVKLMTGADVRTPSPLYIAETRNGDLVLSNTTRDQQRIRRAAHV